MPNDALIRCLKNQLQSHGTANLVPIGWNDSSMSRAFYDVGFIASALDEMGRRLRSHVTDPVTPLERLAIELLLASAYMTKPEDREAAITSFLRWEADREHD